MHLLARNPDRVGRRGAHTPGHGDDASALTAGGLTVADVLEQLGDALGEPAQPGLRVAPPRSTDLGVRGFVFAAPDMYRVTLELGGSSLEGQTTVIDGALVAAGLGVLPAFIRADRAGTGVVIEAELWIPGAVEPGRLRAFEQTLAVQALPVRSLGTAGAEDRSRVTLAISGEELGALRELADVDHLHHGQYGRSWNHKLKAHFSPRSGGRP